VTYAELKRHPLLSHPAVLNIYFYGSWITRDFTKIYVILIWSMLLTSKTKSLLLLMTEVAVSVALPPTSLCVPVR
jgi:hypothetical protein